MYEENKKKVLMTEENIEKYSKEIPDASVLLQKDLQEFEIRMRRKEALGRVIQAIKYLSAYLRDYNYEVYKDFRGEPLTVVIRVYYTPVRLEIEETKGIGIKGKQE